MNIDLKVLRRVGVVLLWALVLGVVVWQGLNSDEEQMKMLTFIEESCSFAIQSVLVTLITLGIVYMAQAIRATEWYDSNGAGTELARIRRRIQTGSEKPSDSLAIAIQYASTTIFLAAIMFGFFLIHN